MIAVQEFFRSGFFGFFQMLGDTTGIQAFLSLSAVLKQGHVLGFGILVIVVILFLPNGIVGDWGKIRKAFGFRAAAERG